MRVPGYYGHFKEREKEEITKLFIEGLTDREIGERLGCSKASIEKVRRRLGLLKSKQERRKPTNEPYGTSIRELVAAKLEKEGYTVRIEPTLHNGIARPDLVGKKDGEEIIVEVKEVKEANNHSLITAAGQLLFYRHLRPNARLMLAVPKWSVKASREALGFLYRCGIALEQF